MNYRDHSSHLSLLLQGFVRRISVIFVFSPLIAAGQLDPAAAGTVKQPANSANAAPSPAAPSGNASIQTEMLSYEAMNTIAHEIAARMKDTSSDACAQRVLIQDSSSLAELTAYLAFDITAKRLLSEYQHVGRGFVAGGAPASMISEAAGIMSEIRSSATYTSQTFQPTAASMNNILEAQLGRLSFTVYSTSNLGTLLDAGQAINKQLADIDSEQAKIADSTKRKDIDTVYASLKTQLSAASPDGTLLGTIVKGAALKAAMTDKYCVLSYSIDGTGGDTRISHPFLWEVLLPSPQPSYSGGAVVSFVYRTSDGKYLTGDSLRYLYGFSKLTGHKLSEGANFTPK